MGILSDSIIKDSIKSGKLSIEPFYEKNLTPNGYDLTISEVAAGRDKTPESGKGKVVSVPPKAWFAVSTEEYVKLPATVTASLWIRTSWARKGAISSFGKIDAGFEGTLTLIAFNSSEDALKIDIGNTFAQMVFERMEGGAEKLYDERSGGYQGQRGVTLEPQM